MNKLVYIICSIMALVSGWVMIAAMIVVLGACVFYTTYITLELPDYSFLIYAVVGCIVMIVHTIKSIEAFKESKAWYDNHIKE